MQHVIKQLLGLYILAILAGLNLPVSVQAAEAGVGFPDIILSAEDENAYSDAEILPVPDSGTVFAIRRGSDNNVLYSFSLTAVNVASLLGTLSQTLYDAHDTTATIKHGERLTLWDVSAHDRYIDIAVDNLSLAATLDQVSVAANCNIFVTNRTIVVDRCD